MPYIARADYAKQKEIVGNGECVTLLRHLTGARASSLWREGDKRTAVRPRHPPVPDAR